MIAMSTLRIYSAHEDAPRAEILGDGSVRDEAQRLVGFVNADGSAGDAYASLCRRPIPAVSIVTHRIYAVQSSF